MGVLYFKTIPFPLECVKLLSTEYIITNGYFLPSFFRGKESELFKNVAYSVIIAHHNALVLF
jgi:hypothetical protein